ncbi:MAG: hypothetical protein ABL908_06565 [Hyphomicrobium sp.]
MLSHPEEKAVAVVIIREMSRIAESHVGHGLAGMPSGALVTDEAGLPIKTVTSAGSAVDSDPMTAKTHFVEIECASAFRFAVRPKSGTISVPATVQHRFVPANTPTLVAVWPGAIISVLA